MLDEEWQKWAKALFDGVKEWLARESEKKEDEYYCKRCGKSLMNRTVYCSVHDGWKFFKTHSGSGRVHTFHIPECPNEKCENHRPSFWDRNLHLDGDTLRGPCYDC